METSMEEKPSVLARFVLSWVLGHFFANWLQSSFCRIDILPTRILVVKTELWEFLGEGTFKMSSSSMQICFFLVLISYGFVS